MYIYNSNVLAYDQLTLAKPPNLLPILGGFAFCCCLLLMNSLSKESLANTSPTAPVMRALAPVMPPTKNKKFEALNSQNIKAPTTPAPKKLLRPRPRPSKNSSGPRTLPYKSTLYPCMHLEHTPVNQMHETIYRNSHYETKQGDTATIM